MSRLQQRSLLLIGLLLLPFLACGPLPERDGLLSNAFEQATATPEASPTPQGDTISFQTLTYRTSLSSGDLIPGTTISYVGKNDNLYEVTIDGLTAMKQPADSLNWKGIIAPGVVGLYTLRLLSDFSGNAYAAGPVQLTILDPFPIELPNSQQFATPLYFNEIVIQYYVPVGYAIPGTTLVYKGRTDVGAELSGTSSYPFVGQGDSLRWTGQLRDNVALRYDLRVVTIQDEGMRVLGTAELWIR